jgi:hypothetical protein
MERNRSRCPDCGAIYGWVGYKSGIGKTAAQLDEMHRMATTCRYCGGTNLKDVEGYHDPMYDAAAGMLTGLIRDVQRQDAPPPGPLPAPAGACRVPRTPGRAEHCTGSACAARCAETSGRTAVARLAALLRAMPRHRAVPEASVMALAGDAFLSWLHQTEGHGPCAVPTEACEAGLRLQDEEAWRQVLPALRECVAYLGGPECRAFGESLRAGWPGMGQAFLALQTGSLGRLRETLAFAGHMLGTDDAERLGIDLSVPVPDPAPRGPSVRLDR